MRKTGWLVWLAVATGPGPALAHSPVPGIEGFYLGLLHPFSTPAQALVMLALGVLVGGFDVPRARLILGAFLVATLAGLFLAARFPDADPALFATGAIVAAVAALLPGRVLALAVALAGVGGILNGIVSMPDPGPTRDRAFTLSGSIIGANLGLLYLYGITTILKERYTWDWVPIAFRVAGAWLGAIALVMLALGYAPDVAAQ